MPSNVRRFPIGKGWVLGVFIFLAGLVFATPASCLEAGDRPRILFEFEARRMGFSVMVISLSVESTGPFHLLTVDFTSTGLIRPFFRVDNRFRSFVQKDGYTPKRYEKLIDQQGLFSKKLSYNDILTFDPETSTVRTERIETQAVKTESVPFGTFDPLSLLFKYMLDPGIILENMPGVHVYDGYHTRSLTPKVTEEKVQTLLWGKIDTVGFELSLLLTSLRNKEGKIKIWFTKDERRYPVRMWVTAPRIGEVFFELKGVRSR